MNAQMLKARIKYCVERAGQSFFGVFGKLVPVKKNRVLFYSFVGNQYSCSPKYICNYINKECPGAYDMIWAFRDPEKFRSQVPAGVKVIKYQSPAFFMAHLSSKYMISNVFPYHLIPKKKNQVMINTWHGGGAYKKVGLTANTSDPRSYAATIRYWQKNTSVYLSSSRLFTKYFIREGMQYKGEVLNTGLPRNDILFSDAAVREKIQTKVRQALGLSSDTKWVLYAPTYRKDDALVHFTFDADRLKAALAARFGGEWAVVTRVHHLTKKKIEGDTVDAGGYPDMQELLLSCDMLISDYSSSIWDDCLMKKPCLLYAYDLDLYRDKTSFFVDIMDWGFPVCETFDGLLSAIGTFDADAFKEAMARHYEMLGGYDNGTGCRQVLEYMQKQ